MNLERKHVRLAALALVASTALVTAGCAGGSASQPNESKPEGEIHVAVYGDAAATAEEAAAERFNETSDVKVVIDKLPGDDTYATSVRTSLGTDNAPDIFMTWGAADLTQLIDAGAVLPLDDYIEEDPELKDAFIPSVFDEQVIDGATYGIPMRGVAPTFLFYNEQVLADAGLEPAQTWDDLLTQSATLSGAGVIPIALAGADKWPTQMWFQYAFAREIGNDAVAEGLAGDAEVWESDGSRAALDNLQGLLDAGAFGTTFDSVGYSNQGTTALLSQGKAAYELMGTWNYATLEGADPDFVAQNLGWVPFPSLDGGSGQSGEIAGNLSNFYNVSADTRYPDVAVEFLKELYSPEFVADQIGLGNLPPTVDAGDAIAADETLDENTKTYLTFVVDLVAAAPTFQLSWDRVVPTEQKEALTDAVAGYFNGSLDADAWIAQMQSITAAD
ncbi:ABC transporter substrate-binding protein [Agromyces sp. MMS24-K17]|uniref:ABC transporter substrate-binding protein n=1 Tax=Agromyces sp. MMS24-K17 TaxID=3372850 RepID=UPI00375513BD